MHEREYLPLRRLSQHRRCHAGRPQARLIAGRKPPMQAFQYSKADNLEGAVRGGSAAGTKYVAGGTTLIDLMKLNVESPTTVLDINGLPLDRIESTPDGGIRIGAMVRNSDVAHHATVQQQYPVLSQALLSGASPQIRNMAS